MNYINSVLPVIDHDFKVRTSQIDTVLTVKQCCQPEDEDKHENLVIICKESAKVSFPMII